MLSPLHSCAPLWPKPPRTWEASACGAQGQREKVQPALAPKFDAAKARMVPRNCGAHSRRGGARGAVGHLESAARTRGEDRRRGGCLPPRAHVPGAVWLLNRLRLHPARKAPGVGVASTADTPGSDVPVSAESGDQRDRTSQRVCPSHVAALRPAGHAGCLSACRRPGLARSCHRASVRSGGSTAVASASSSVRWVSSLPRPAHRGQNCPARRWRAGVAGAEGAW